MHASGMTLAVKKDLMGALYDPMGSIVISSLNYYSTGPRH